MNSDNVNLNEESSQSQNARILEYLEKGESITSLESLWLCESLRLSARIFDLVHDRGANIKSVTVFRKESETRKKKKFAAYYIPEAVKEKYHLDDSEIEDAVISFTTARINRE